MNDDIIFDGYIFFSQINAFFIQKNECVQHDHPAAGSIPALYVFSGGMALLRSVVLINSTNKSTSTNNYSIEVQHAHPAAGSIPALYIFSRGMTLLMSVVHINSINKSTSTNNYSIEVQHAHPATSSIPALNILHPTTIVAYYPDQMLSFKHCC